MKKGDKVRCIWVHKVENDRFNVGDVYNISYSDSIAIGVIDKNGNEFRLYSKDSSFAKFEPVTDQQPEPIDKGEKYQREIAPGVFVDIYDVLEAWGVSCPARQHAIKKLLAAGQRGHKSEIKDLQEAHHSAHRSIMFQIERERKGNGKSLSDIIAD